MLMVVIVAVALVLTVAMTGAGDPKAIIGKTLSNQAGALGDLHLPQFELELPQLGAPFARHKPPSSKAQAAARFAMAQRGDRYVFGASGPDTWDCSGLTSRAWAKAGVRIPRTAQGQLNGLRRVSGRPQRGDLIVYRSRVSPSGYHVAIAVGQGQMVEARGRRWGVTQGRIRGGWVGVRRPR
jgi:cell wall-associated NlpC family hydrolase